MTVKPSPAFLTVLNAFTHACNIELDTLTKKIDEEQEKDEVEEDNVDELENLANDIQSALDAAEDIETE